MYLAFGIAALLVALVLTVVLLRLARTLAALEELVLTSTVEMRQVLPEVRESLGNVNDITAGMNVVLRTAGTGAQDLSNRARHGIKGRALDFRAWSYGAAVAARSLWAPMSEPEPGLPEPGLADLSTEGDVNG